MHVHDKRQASSYFRRIESKLGVRPVRSDDDLALLVEARIPTAAVEVLSSHGISDEEIYTLVISEHSLAHRRTRGELLTQNESERAVRLVRVAALTEEVFGDDVKAHRWLRKPKARLNGHSPLESLQSREGACLVEEMLLQLDNGFAA